MAIYWTVKPENALVFTTITEADNWYHATAKSWIDYSVVWNTSAGGFVIMNFDETRMVSKRSR